MHTPVQTLNRLLALPGLFVALLFASLQVAQARDYPARAEVRAFIDELVERHSFDPVQLVEVFSRVQHSDAAVRLMTPPPRGGKRSWRAYRSRFIDATRITAGLAFWDEHATTLAQASRHFGVPEEIIVSIIGVETVFGRVTGDHRVINVLTTLAFDYPRRADYFRSELEQYLLLARAEGFDPFEVRGSFAGAIGLPQFMPGSIRRWAVDFDGDGRIDLRASVADAIGSVASFLAGHGWVPGEPARYSARIADLASIGPLLEAGITPAFTIAELKVHGVSSRDPVSVDAKLALIDLPNGDEPADFWLGAQNFYVITRYNRSSFYASAVLDLAEVLRERRLP